MNIFYLLLHQRVKEVAYFLYPYPVLKAGCVLWRAVLSLLRCIFVVETTKYAEWCVCNPVQSGPGR